MKRSLLSAAAVMLIILLAAICFTACGGGGNSKNDASGDTASTEGYVITEEDGVIGGELEDGAYKMTDLYIFGSNDAASSKVMDQMVTAGINTDLVVDGTKIVILELEYTLENGKFVNSDSYCTYAVDGSKVTVVDSDGSKMLFEKK